MTTTLHLIPVGLGQADPERWLPHAARETRRHAALLHR